MWLNEGAWPWDRQKTLGATPACLYCPWTRACWYGFRGRSCWCLAVLSFIYSSAFLQDWQLRYWVQESLLFPELFLTFSEDCLCIDLLYSLRWTNFPEGTSQFSTFFSEIQSSYSAKRLRMSLTKLPHLILDIGEEFVKNIIFCMTEYCNTQSIQYFTSPKFHYFYAQYNIQKFSSVNIISIQLVQ